MSVASSCGTRPILERAARYSLMMSKPSALTLPPLGLTIPQMMLMRVVLPAPFGPSRAKISPRRISRLTFFSASKPEAYFFDRLCTEMMGDMASMAGRAFQRGRGGIGRMGRPGKVAEQLVVLAAAAKACARESAACVILALAVAAPSFGGAAERPSGLLHEVNIIDGADGRDSLLAIGPRLGLSTDEMARIRKVSG